MSNAVSNAIELSIANRIANAVPDPDRIDRSRTIALHFNSEPTPYLKHLDSACKNCVNAKLEERTIQDKKVQQQLCSTGWGLYEDYAFRQYILTRMMEGR